MSNITAVETTVGDIVFGVISCVCFVLGTVGNAIIVSYFISKVKKTANTIIFINIAVIDIIISLLIISVGVSNFNSGKPMLFANKIYCALWAISWDICVRMSIFLIALISITRAVSLLLVKHEKIERSFVIIPIVVYFILMVIQETVPYWYGAHYRYSNGMMNRCYSTSKDFIEVGSLNEKVYLFFRMLFEWALPVLPVVISCTFIVYTLISSKRTRRVSIAGTRSDEIKRHSTITVILLTIGYLVLNLPVCIFLIMIYVLILYDKDLDLNRYFWIYFRTYSIPLNSLFNMIVYFCRIAKLREYAINMLRDTSRYRYFEVTVLVDYRRGNQAVHV